MRLNFRQGIVSHQSGSFLSINGSGNVDLLANNKPLTLNIAHKSTDYIHSEDNTVVDAWTGPFAGIGNQWLYIDFNRVTFDSSFGTTNIEPAIQSAMPGSGDAIIVSVVPGDAGIGSFVVSKHYLLSIDRSFTVVNSTGNDGTYTVASTSFNITSGETTITVNQPIPDATIDGSLTLDVDSTGAPLLVDGRHWYDTSTNIHYIRQANSWTEVLRIFVAMSNNGNFISLSINGPLFTGTQIGDSSTVLSGRVMFDESIKPLVRDDGTFVTTEDQLFTNQSRTDGIRLESSVSKAENIGTFLGAFTIVTYVDDAQITTATYDSVGTSVVGVLTEDLNIKEIGSVVLQGVVTNPNWSWITSGTLVGSPLWVHNGELIDTNPNINDPITYPTPRVPAARVLSNNTVIFEQGLGGVGPTGLTGTVGDLPPATENDLGAVTLLTPSSDPDRAWVVSDTDSRLSDARLALPHIHPAANITFTPGNGIVSNEVQSGMLELGISKLSLAGDTMVGSLVLVSDPIIPLEAATKQYVDNLVSGLIWLEPVDKINLIADDIPTPPGTPEIGDAYIVPAAATGDWSTITEGNVTSWDGTIWTDDGPIAGFDALPRLGIAFTSSATPSGSFAGQKNNIAVYNGSGVLTGFEIPLDNNAVYVRNPLSLHAYKQYAFNGTGWVLFSGGQQASKLDDLLDVDTSTVLPTDGQALAWNNANSLWEPQTIASGGGIGDLIITSIPASDTITSTKDLFVLDGPGGAGIHITTVLVPAVPDSGYNFAGNAEVGNFAKPVGGSITYGHVVNDGSKVLWNDNSGVNPKIVHVRDLTVPYDITTVGILYDVSYTGSDNSGSQGIFKFSPDGLKAYSLTSSRYIEEIPLTVPYDLTTAGPVVLSPNSVSDFSPVFSEDGLYIYVGTVGGPGPDIFIVQYDLSVAWDITTMTQTLFYSATADIPPTPSLRVAISNDGTKLFGLATDVDYITWTVQQWDLATPYDVSTAVYNSGAPVWYTDIARTWSLSPDGTNMYFYSDYTVTQFDIAAGDGIAGSNSTASSLLFSNVEKISTTSDGVQVSGQLVLPSYTTATLPNTTISGGVVYDTDTNTLKYYDSTSWSNVGLQTPWTSNIDANGFSLITQDNTSGTGTASSIILQSGAHTDTGSNGTAGDIVIAGGNNNFSIGVYAGTAGAAGNIILYPGSNTAIPQGYGGPAYGHGIIELRSSSGYAIVGTTDVSYSSKATNIQIQSGSVLGIGQYQYAGSIGLAAGNNSTLAIGGRIAIQEGRLGYAYANYGYTYAGVGGDITLYGGASKGEMTEGGYYGNVVTSYKGGAINLKGGSSQYNIGGDINITAGHGSNINGGGSIILRPGSDGTQYGISGYIDIRSPLSSNDTAAVRLWSDNTGYYSKFGVAITHPANTLFTLPPTNGLAGEVLTLTAPGVTSWAAAGGGASNNWLTANIGADFTTAPIAAGNNAIALGNGALAPEASSIAIGDGATTDLGVYGVRSVSIGNGSYSRRDGVSIGTNSDGGGVDSVTIGLNAHTGYKLSVGIGPNSSVTGNYAIAIGSTATVGVDGVTLANNAIAIGELATATGSYSIALGKSAIAGEIRQVVIGPNIAAASVTTDVAYSVKLGYGATSTAKNLLHLFSKGKLELYGDEAQFVLPNYTTAEIAVPLPGVSGGLVYDTDTSELKAYDGAAWNAIINVGDNIDLVSFSETAGLYGTTGAIALDTSLGTYFYPTGTTTGSITFSFTNPAATGKVTSFTLEMLGASNFPPVWPASVNWPGGTEPTWTTGIDVVSFSTRDNGTTWLGMLGGTAFA